MLNYPHARKANIKEEKFGQIVEDPYRWMEDDHSPETVAFVEEQMALTEKYLEKIPERATIREQLANLANYETYGSFFVIKDKILFAHNSGKQSQKVWYIQDGLAGKPEVLIDPNRLSEDGTVAISMVAPSKNGRYLTYLSAESGSDWQTLRILDLETKKPLDDKISWVKYTHTAWQGDGFYYSAYQKPQTDASALSAINENQQIYYHKLDTTQNEDQLVFEDPDHPLRYHILFTDQDENHAYLETSEGTYGSEIYAFDLATHEMHATHETHETHELQPIFTGFHADRHYVDSYHGKAIFITDEQSPNRKLLSYDPTTKETQELVPEAKYSLENARLFGDQLYLFYLEDVTTRIHILDLKCGEEKCLELPELGTVYALDGSTELAGVIFSFGSFIRPLELYYSALGDSHVKAFKQSQLPIDHSDFITERHFIKASDGALVPLFTTYKEGLEKDGDNPTLLYAYGGFSINMQANYSPLNTWLIEHGGIYAQANIRGGAEYGEVWHQQGMLHNKQRVFDDFHECAEYLIEEGYTSHTKLAIRGGSNGGLLVGAVLNQRPDLYGVAFPEVGVMDMLRYHLFTIGWGWVPEYGNPDEEADFSTLYRYSPLHNIEAQDYPATMIMTADHDDRVVPAHSLKYAAALQEKNTSSKPILLRIDKKAGHGAGKPFSKVLNEAADRYAFMFHEMGELESI